jgi:glycosyltransferase involved in cell wall biosynthesis
MNQTKNIFQKASHVVSHILQTASLENDIIVFSHLRWNFVFQRPQHIITRLAKKRKILFVEEPIPFKESEHGKAHLLYPEKNITILQPKISSEEMLTELPRLIKKQNKSLNLDNPLLWFYSAAFSELISEIKHSLVVYDCMDELSAFDGASPSLIAQEKYLLSEADVVFTGGKSLYEEKKKWAENVFCFPSSVDKKHFSQVGLREDLVLRPKERKISHPTVGFYGVLDERLDISLLEQVARRMPKVNFIMIGPVVKIDPAALPHLPNIYYLGPKSYEQLPIYLQKIDIAIIPFALNESTKFISPTKTLEFMAARKPIISTPITDVVRDYKKVIRIVTSPDSFAKAINYYLNESPTQKVRREKRYEAILAQTSWDATVVSMKKIIHDALEKSEERVQQRTPLYRPSFSQIVSSK